MYLGEYFILVMLSLLFDCPGVLLSVFAALSKGERLLIHILAYISNHDGDAKVNIDEEIYISLTYKSRDTFKSFSLFKINGEYSSKESLTKI